ncbi:MAG: ATP-binding protein [Polyangiaceae bacterium]
MATSRSSNPPRHLSRVEALAQLARLGQRTLESPAQLRELAGLARRAVGARTFAVAAFVGNEVVSCTSGSDQHQLSRWTAHTLGEFDAQQRDVRSRIEQRAPTGTRVSAVMSSTRLLGVVAARGFRSRDSDERQAIMVSAVADLLVPALSSPRTPSALRVCDATVSALGSSLASTRATLDAKSAFRAIARAFQDVIPLSKMSIVIRDENASYRRFAAFDENGASVSCSAADISSLERQAMETGRAVYSDDVAAEADQSLRDLSECGLSSVVAVPLGARGRPYGALLIAEPASRAHDAFTLEVIEAISKQLSPLIADFVEEDHDPALDELRERLVRSEQLASVGQLAAGVAHEVNNPLSVILSNLQTLAGRARRADRVDADEVNEIASESIDAVQRIAAAVEDLRAFARMDRGQRVDLDLNDVVRDAARIAKNEIRHRASLSLELGAIPPVRGDRMQLTQVVMNLLVNAAQAFDQAPARENRVRVTTFTQGERICVAVQDNGVGIADASRIFEPFFTTKRDVGTGLGLSVAADIALRHKGLIEVESEAGAGSRFVLSLPLQSGLSVKQASAPPSALRAHYRARVLIVDDEPSILRAFQRLLRDRHEVVTAPGGKEALQLVAGDQQFDVILCDVMMPDVDGVAFYEGLQKTAPPLQRRVVFCTGGEFTERARSFLTRIERPVLNKPVDAQVLLDTIARMLVESNVYVPGGLRSNG